jgi:hypothetical protein
LQPLDVSRCRCHDGSDGTGGQRPCVTATAMIARVTVTMYYTFHLEQNACRSLAL